MPFTPEEMALRVKMKQMHDATEQIMAEAVSPEKLRNNPYKGKPLDLSVNPFEKERALGHRMLKSSGFAPAWIEMKKALLEEQRDLRRMIKQYVAQASSPSEAEPRRGGQRNGPRGTEEIRKPDVDTNSLHKEFLQHIYDRVARLRKKIERYNLETPLMEQQLMNVRPEEWVEDVRQKLAGPREG